MSAQLKTPEVRDAKQNWEKRKIKKQNVNLNFVSYSLILCDYAEQFCLACLWLRENSKNCKNTILLRVTLFSLKETTNGEKNKKLPLILRKNACSCCFSYCTNCAVSTSHQLRRNHVRIINDYANTCPRSQRLREYMFFMNIFAKLNNFTKQNSLFTKKSIENLVTLSL